MLAASTLLAAMRYGGCTARPMEIRIPDFGSTHCLYFTACGQVASSDIKGLKNDKELFVRWERNKRVVFVNAMSRINQKELHLHIDVLNFSAFKRANVPEPPDSNASFEDLNRLLSRFDGQPIDAGVNGFFRAAKTQYAIVHHYFCRNALA